MLWYLIRRFRYPMLLAAVSSVVHGATGIWLLALVSQAVTAQGEDRRVLAWVFAGAVVLMALSQLAMHLLFELLSHRALAELRSAVSAKVMAVELRHLEIVGGDKVQAALSEHSARVAEFFVLLPTLVTNSVIVVGSMGYMAYLSLPAMGLTMSVIALGAFGYYLAQRRATQHFGAAAELQGALHGYFRVIVDGAKELRLNRKRRGSFAGDLLGRSIAEVRRQRTIGMAIFHLAAAWGRFLIFGLIGLVLFVVAGDGDEQAKLMVGFALVLIFMINPLQNLLGTLPAASVARHSSNQIDEVTSRLTAGGRELASGEGISRFSRIRLEGVSHHYRREDSDEIFTLGPVDIEFTPGEVTFIVGGNGSGKTTLAKLIVGLYPPEKGRVTVDGESIDDAKRDDYRQAFSAVFADSHLFVHLLEVGRRDIDERANRLLQRLELDSKVSVRDGAFSTRALSQGQRKRLALLVAAIEDRPFVVFDEWAADQDPVFKDLFYRELLPELKAAGKTVLVVTHDDRYFELADRLFRMEDGQLSFVSETTHGKPKQG